MKLNARIAGANDVDELQSRLLDGLDEHIESSASWIRVLDPSGHGMGRIEARGVSGFFRSRYEELGPSGDPVFTAVLEHGRALDDAMVMSTHEWHAAALYTGVLSLNKIENLLEAPIAVEGAAVGVLAMGRRAGEARFTSEDRALAEVIGNLVGVVLRALRTHSAVERERDGLVDALEVSADAIVVTDLDRARRRCNASARHLLADLKEGEAALDELMARPVRVGSTTRHEVQLPCVDGSRATLRARSTVSSAANVLVSVIDLVTTSPTTACTPVTAALTPREREVAHLAAQGLRDREIAKQLYLSEYTVKQYLRASYAKLGLRSRVELSHLLGAGESRRALAPGA